MDTDEALDKCELDVIETLRTVLLPLWQAILRTYPSTDFDTEQERAAAAWAGPAQELAKRPMVASILNHLRRGEDEKAAEELDYAVKAFSERLEEITKRTPPEPL